MERFTEPRSEPGGYPEISRWSNAATPPDTADPNGFRTPEACQRNNLRRVPVARCGANPRCRVGSGIPPGCRADHLRVPVVGAVLDHRLTSGTPPRSASSDRFARAAGPETAGRRRCQDSGTAVLARRQAHRVSTVREMSERQVAGRRFLIDLLGGNTGGYALPLTNTRHLFLKRCSLLADAVQVPRGADEQLAVAALIEDAPLRRWWARPSGSCGAVARRPREDCDLPVEVDRVQLAVGGQRRGFVFRVAGRGDRPLDLACLRLDTRQTLANVAQHKEIAVVERRRGHVAGDFLRLAADPRQARSSSRPLPPALTA